jgi:hypothetical protein
MVMGKHSADGNVTGGMVRRCAAQRRNTCAKLKFHYLWDVAMRKFRYVLGVAAMLAALAVGRADAPGDDAYLKLGFERLSAFKFVPPAYDPATDAKTPPPTGDDQIPAEVKGWNGKKAMITGFMLPTKMENGKATEFLIMANQMACCFGTLPNMNDWVVVRMAQGAPVTQDVPISFYGTIKVGAMYEDGYMTGIYSMDAERMGDVKE